MIVGIDARAAAEEPAGGGRVVRELLGALATVGGDHRFRLYCRQPWLDAPSGPRFRWSPIGLPDPAWHAAAAARANASCDVYLSTNSYLTPWMLTIPSIALVYDLISFIPDAAPQARAARIELATLGLTVRRAAQLVCISRSTERDLLERFPRAAGKTSVIPLAADARFGEQPTTQELGEVARRYGVEPGGYVLATGTLEPRKNLLRLIRAHAGLPDDLRRQHPLVIAGPRGWEEQAILAAAGHRPDDVRLAGFVPDADLARLYAGCSVFCFPSLYEGFGLPVLEAMAAGAPVIASDVSSLPEVGGDAVAYVRPRDERSIAAELERVLRSPDERAALAGRGRERAASFSWERCAHDLLLELERVAALVKVG
jgi:glycosyltransferase involved in cell wall biosynthesis